MTTVERFEDLDAWKSARELTRLVYEVTGKAPFSRDLGLRDQIRRASVSVMSNIAEGFESRTTGLFVDFLGRAKASAGEVRAQLFVAVDVGYLTQEDFTALSKLAERTSRQIGGLLKYLQGYSSTTRVREELHDYPVYPEEPEFDD
jgi:four helix bundle protein